jgi:hypothetical protein
MSFNTMQHTQTIGPVSLDGDVSHVVGKIEGTVDIQSCAVHNNASAASHATNFVTFNLVNGGTDGAGTTVIATATTAATNVSAFAPFELTVTDANKTVTDGQVLIFERAEENTNAPALATGVVQVRYLQTVAP